MTQTVYKCMYMCACIYIQYTYVDTQSHTCTLSDTHTHAHTRVHTRMHACAKFYVVWCGLNLMLMDDVFGDSKCTHIAWCSHTLPHIYCVWQVMCQYHELWLLIVMIMLCHMWMIMFSITESLCLVFILSWTTDCLIRVFCLLLSIENFSCFRVSVGVMDDTPMKSMYIVVLLLCLVDGYSPVACL